ncbi:hypothetical protein IC582_009933 [Cucumis melo]|uniref:Uncharacterized protein LOC103491444 isoform X1 n=1 Tax=Cucumis melo TaxID=3656 RepID=A0A1S3BMF4_CUCME|nr:uncharacterized protein LOC103491444 isoform X1 [Cucumis melo]
MKKKLDTRFPAARIKKIMQADEDVGKIAMAVPLLVSKALELFLQNLCDRTYEITLKRGARTMNSLHLKQCIQTFNVFDFLRDVVGKVPDSGGSDAAEDRHISKRRKVADEDVGNDSDEESKRSKVTEAGHCISGRGKGRGRGRGRGRSSRHLEKDTAIHYNNFEDDLEIPNHPDDDLHKTEPDNGVAEARVENDNTLVDKALEPSVRNFDLNVNLDEDGDSTSVPVVASTGSPVKPPTDSKHDEYPGWSVAEMEKMAIDPIQLANMNETIDDEEDYDEDG